MTNVAFGFSFPIRDIGERLATLDALDPFALTRTCIVGLSMASRRPRTLRPITLP
jgi:hypothetical protein